MTDVKYVLRKLCDAHEIRLTLSVGFGVAAPVWQMTAKSEDMRIRIQDSNLECVTRMMLAAVTTKIEEQQ